jgi:hypothetical protein
LLVYATNLLALANKAMDSGDAAFADRLTIRATEYLDQAIPIEKPVTQQQLQRPPDLEKE